MDAGETASAAGSQLIGLPLMPVTQWVVLVIRVLIVPRGRALRMAVCGGARAGRRALTDNRALRARPGTASLVATPMESANDIDKRLTDLEVKASLTEDLVDRLNEVVVRQQEQIDLLLREVGRLARQGGSAGDEPAFRSLRDEIPPHY
jgi:SlyX protein